MSSAEMTPEMGPEMREVIVDPGGTLLALDFDGTLAHIVDDPAQAFGQQHALDALSRLGPVVGQIAIVTGRPVQQVLELGGFDGRPGLESLVVCGQYGAERWDASDGPPHPSVDLEPVLQAIDALPAWLADHGASGARIERKGLAVGVHTRGMEPGTRDALFAPLSVLAAQLGLVAELGREVIELRASGWDKGRVVDELVAEFGVRHIVFVGDDLGDLPAFNAVDRLRSAGIGGLLVCSGSEEQAALAERADLVLDGPDGVAEWLSTLADAIESSGFGLDPGPSHP
jgi:trehalose 6-phosphate phosphatase